MFSFTWQLDSQGKIQVLQPSQATQRKGPDRIRAKHLITVKVEVLQGCQARQGLLYADPVNLQGNTKTVGEQGTWAHIGDHQDNFQKQHVKSCRQVASKTLKLHEDARKRAN